MQTLCEITHSMTPRVDREAGVIRGVKVLGRESKNGRTYSDKALSEAAKLYDRRDVNLNHPPRDKAGAERPVQDMFGWLESVKVEQDGVYADLHYATAHPMAPAIVEIAQKNPMRLGLSHNAEGTVAKVGGRNVVESIQSVRSVDLVQTPATVNGLFEATAAERHPSKTCRQILEDYTGSSLPPVPGMEDESEPEEVAEIPEDDPQREAKAALTQVFSAALMAGGDLRSILAQVVALATAMMGSMPDPADAEAGDEEGEEAEDGESIDPADETEDPAAEAGSSATDTQSSNGQPPEDDPMQRRRNQMPESVNNKSVSSDPTIVRLAEQLEKLTARLDAQDSQNTARSLLESANVEPTPARITAVLAVTDEAQRKELIESFPQRERISHRGPRPAVRTALQESQGGDTRYPSDLRSFVSSIKR